MATDSVNIASYAIAICLLLLRGGFGAVPLRGTHIEEWDLNEAVEVMKPVNDQLFWQYGVPLILLGIGIGLLRLLGAIGFGRSAGPYRSRRRRH